MWAVGTLFTLVTIALLVALLVVNLDAVKWENLSRERIVQVALFIGIAVALTTLIVLLAIGGASLGWTGFGDKTFWDWLQLLSALAIPVVLAAAGLWFTAQQDQRQQEIEGQRTKQAQKIEDQRAKAERALAEQRAQDEALQAYLDQMSNLLLERNLRKAEADSEVRTLARARTLTVLSRLDSARKERLLQFLYETGLLHKEKHVIDLTGADLSGIDLHLNNLSGGGPFLFNSSPNQGTTRPVKPSNAANLSGAIMSDANLEHTLLSDTDLSETDLRDADLSNADLSNADLNTANMQDANLSNAYLPAAGLSFADLSDADLSGAYLTKEFSESRDEANRGPYARNVDLAFAILKNSNLSDANLSGANLSWANLSNANLSANLSGANLSNANLSNANLSNTNLSGANLSKAYMSGVEGITKEELEKQTSKLEGAIMPDGSVSSVEFEPALSVRLSEEWESPNEVDNQIYLYGKGGYLIFSKPRHVFDPSTPSEQKEVPAPENVDEWVSWFQSHPNLETSKLGPASVGGASGMRIAVALTSTPENYPQEVCQGTPCVPLYPLGHGFPSENMTIDSEGYNKYRFIIVDVGGETVVIPAIAREGKFDEFLPKAQKVLDTAKWQE